MAERKQFDIAIIGAGPAGCSAALTLQNSNCSVALFDKSIFPREKICGDGLCDRAINTLKKIDNRYYEEFLKLSSVYSIPHTKLWYKNKSYIVDFENYGYTCKRSDFDSFLFSSVQKDCKNAEIFQNCNIVNYSHSNDGITLYNANQNAFEAKLVIFCCGATSKFAKHERKTLQKEQMGVAVRAYYQGVTGLTDAIELWYDKDYFPGYFWIFPLSDGTANVGFGCSMNHQLLETENIRDIFKAMLQKNGLRERFVSATRISRISGGLVPYNQLDFSLVDDNIIMCGDAAHLIDPISGGGVGNALLSGYFAAKQAEQCISRQDFSKNIMKNYETMLRKRIEKEMKNRLKIQKILVKCPCLLDVLAFFGRRKCIMKAIEKWYFK